MFLAGFMTWQVSVSKLPLYNTSSSLARSGLIQPLGRWFLLISIFSSRLNSPLTTSMDLESTSIRPSAMTPTGGPGLSSQELLFPMAWVIAFRPFAQTFSLFQTSMTLGNVSVKDKVLDKLWSISWPLWGTEDVKLQKGAVHNSCTIFKIFLSHLTIDHWVSELNSRTGSVWFMNESFRTAHYLALLFKVFSE